MYKLCRNVTHSLKCLTQGEQLSWFVWITEAKCNRQQSNFTCTHRWAWTSSREYHISLGRTADTCKFARVRSIQTHFLDRLKTKYRSDVETVKYKFAGNVVYLNARQTSLKQRHVEFQSNYRKVVHPQMTFHLSETRMRTLFLLKISKQLILTTVKNKPSGTSGFTLEGKKLSLHNRGV